jgi:peptide subunit release factor 1 (eRF1)
MTKLPIERTIDEILDFDAHGARALTLYLSTDPAREAGADLRAQLQDLLHPIAERLRADPAARAQLDRELVDVRTQLDTMHPPPRGLAVFSCAVRGFLQAVPLPERVAPFACWQEELEIRPLLAAVDEHERTIVLLVDKEHARFFRTFLGQIEEIASFQDDIPRKHSQGGEAQRRLQRDHEWHVTGHARRAVDTLTRFSDRDATDRILVGGTPEVLAEVRRLLPRRLRNRIRGEVKASLFASLAEVGDALHEVEQRAARDDEEQLVTELIERVGTGHAAIGATAVIDAVQEQRCYLLITSAGAQLPGYGCTRCDFIASEPSAQCPLCTGPMQALADVLGTLARATVRQGGKVMEVRGAAAAQLQPAGVAAMLRYEVPHTTLVS